MKPGKELDALVAEKVMGWEGVLSTFGCDTLGKAIPPYSTDIAAAWIVIEKMIELGFCALSVDYVGTWRCFMGRGGLGRPPVHADTPSLAICLAALKAVGAEVEDA